MRNVQYRSLFEPIQGTGGLLLLNQNSGIFYEDDASAFYEVRHVEAIPVVYPVVWTDPNTAVPGGYAADSVANSSHIAANGGSAATNGPLNSLIFPKRMLAQVRFRGKAVSTLTGATDDYAFTIQAPAGTPRWRLPKLQGVMSFTEQAQDPNDLFAMPPQGSNEGIPSGFPGLDPWNIAAPTELFCYGGNSAQITVINNGSAITAQGAIAMKMSIFLYNLRQIPIDANAVEVNLLGETVKVPSGVNLDDVAVVDITGAPIPAAS